jgi:hypothetical protein
MLSARGARFAEISYAHGRKFPYDLEKRPDGEVSLANAENVSLYGRWRLLLKV